MNQTKIIRIVIIGFLSWLVLSIAGFFFGERAITQLIPLYETVAETVRPEFHARIYLDDDKTEQHVVLASTALKAVPITNTSALNAGRTVESKITVFHTMVPLIILIVTFIAYPVSNVTQRLSLIAIGVPIGLGLVSMLTAPMQLLGQLEVGFLNAAAQAGFNREPSWVFNWFRFTEGGARWFLPLLIGLGLSAGLCKLVGNQEAPSD